MSGFNERHGLKRAGKRPMMRLPKDKARRLALTAATCPTCKAGGVIENKVHGKYRRMCSRCGESWDAPTTVDDQG